MPYRQCLKLVHKAGHVSGVVLITLAHQHVIRVKDNRLVALTFDMLLDHRAYKA